MGENRWDWFFGQAQENVPDHGQGQRPNGGCPLQVGVKGKRKKKPPIPSVGKKRSGARNIWSTNHSAKPQSIKKQTYWGRKEIEVLESPEGWTIPGSESGTEA